MSIDLYEVRPRKDRRGVDLIFNALPFGRLWYGELNAASNAIDYAKFRSRSHDAVVSVYEAAGNPVGIASKAQVGAPIRRSALLGRGWRKPLPKVFLSGTDFWIDSVKAILM
jgi:hypothetical protein